MCDKPLECNSVRDHYHITGKCRGAAQSACNVKLRLNPNTTVLPVVFHNLRGNDFQLLMQAILKVEGKVSCIPNNTKKYLPFSMGQLRFIDSAQFLLASLNKLLAANQAEPFKITAQYEPNGGKTLTDHGKDVYPYEYMDSWARFERRSEKRASASTAQTPHTTTPDLGFHGTPFSRR